MMDNIIQKTMRFREWKRCLAMAVVVSLLMGETPLVHAQTVSDGDATLLTSEVSDGDTSEAADFGTVSGGNNMAVAAVSEEEASVPVDAEIISYSGVGVGYYELQQEYSSYGPSEVVIRLHFADESYLDAQMWDDTWNEYGIYYQFVDAYGNQPDYDENGKYPVGQYYYEFMIGEDNFELKIPFEIRNAADVETVLSEGHPVEGLKGTVNLYDYNERHTLKITIDQAGYYIITSTSDGNMNLYDSSFQELKSIYGNNLGNALEKGTYYLSVNATEDFDVSLEKFKAEEITAESTREIACDAGQEKWFVFTPTESGAYKINAKSNSGAAVYVYDKDMNYNTGWGGSEISFGEEFKAGVPCYFCIMTQEADTVTFSLEMMEIPVSAELLSYSGVTEGYYELMQEYSCFSPNNVKIRLHMEDGTYIDAQLWDTVWNEYDIYSCIKDSEGNDFAYDENGKCAVGDYYLEYIVLGRKFDLKIPFTVKSVADIEKTLSVDNPVKGLSETADIYDDFNKRAIKVLIAETGYYNITSTSWGGMELYDSSYQRLICEMNIQNLLMKLETGTYYLRVGAMEEFDVSLEKIQTEEITAGSTREIACGAGQGKWFVFTPTESGVYKIGTKSNSSTVVYVYDQDMNLNTSRGGTEISFRQEFEAGVPCYFRVMTQETDTVTFSLEMMEIPVSAELLSYSGVTEGYYELMEAYSGYYPGNVIIRLHMKDGTYIDAEAWDTVWNKYSICLYTKDAAGNDAVYDDSGKYAVGEYYLEYTILDRKYDLKIPFTIKSVVDIEKTLSAENPVKGLIGSSNKHTIKVSIAETCYYHIESTSWVYMELYDSSYQQLKSIYGESLSVKLEKGTYYLQISGTEDFDVSLEKYDIKELTLNQTESVVIDQQEERAEYVFIPAETGYYTLESSGDYDTYAILKVGGNQIAVAYDFGENNNFALYAELTAGETYIYEVGMQGVDQTGSFDMVLKKAPKISEIQIAFSNRNPGVLYYGLSTTPYRSLAEGLNYILIYEDGSSKEMQYNSADFWSYFSVAVKNKDTGEYGSLDDKGMYPLGTYEVTATCMKADGLTASAEIKVLSPEEITTVLTTENSVTDLPGNQNGIIYSGMKIVIEKAGVYSLTSTSTSCYAKLFDENMNSYSDYYTYLSGLKIEADGPQTYYLCIMSYEEEDYDVTLEKRKEIAALEVSSVYTDKLYNAMGWNSLSQILNRSLTFKATLDNEEEIVFTTYSSLWYQYGMTYTLTSADDPDKTISSTTNLSVGNYELIITCTRSQVSCKVPFRVASVEEAGSLSLGESVTTSEKIQFYKLEVTEEGAYVIAYDAGNNFFGYPCLMNDDGTVSTYGQSFTCNGESPRYLHLKEGTNYLYIRNLGAPDAIRFSVSKMPDIESLEYKGEGTYTFAYGDWGYYVGESVSGGKYTSGQTVSGSTNKTPLVSNSPVDYYVSGTRVSKFNFDMDFEAKLADGSVIETFCNSLLWKAYGIIQSILNLDGTPVYTDHNGFVAAGKYLVEFVIGEKNFRIPFAVAGNETNNVEIIVQPASVAVAQDTETELTVKVQGNEIIYQWQYAVAGSEEWQNCYLSGYNTDTLKLKATVYRNGMQFRCKITDNTGNILISEAATVTIAKESVALKITSQPEEQKVQVGTAVSFTAKAEGEGLTYQWQYAAAGSDDWQKCYLSGYNTDTLSCSATVYRNGMQFRCVVTDNQGNTVVSETAGITIVKETVSLKITSQPESQKVQAGTAVSFTVGAEGEGLTYQWQYATAGSEDWQKCYLSGYNTDTLSCNATVYRDGMQFRCVVTDQDGNAESSEAACIIIVKETISSLKITAQPQDQNAEAGTTVSFVVEAEGDGLTYQWQYAAAGSSEWANCYLSGYATKTLTTTATVYRDGMQFRCIVTDAEGKSEVSDAAVLKIAKEASIKITLQPQDQLVEVNETVTFSVKVEGTALKYQWQYALGGSDQWQNCYLSGYNTATLTTKATIYRNGMQLKCIITDSEGNTVESETAKITISSN